MKPGGACQGKYWGQRRFNPTKGCVRYLLVLNAYQALQAARRITTETWDQSVTDDEADMAAVHGYFLIFGAFVEHTNI
jgi:hypothetical protein